MYEIAHRVLALRSDPPRDVVVTVGVPYEEPTGEWSCPYRIDGLDGWEHERKVTGLDSLGAVELAMAMVRAAVAGSHEAKEGLLSWDDVPSGPRAQTVYRHFGFEDIGTRRRYYDDGTDAIMMRRKLGD